MAKCKNAKLFDKIGIEKMDNTTEVDIEVLHDLSDCKKINTKNYVTASAGKYQRTIKPTNIFECQRTANITSGTYTFNAASGNAVYALPYDGNEYAAGIITLYAKGETSVTLTISDTDEFTNADVYTVSNGVDAGGDFKMFAFDLASTPTSEAGTGWTPSATVNYIKVATTKAGAGISSIMISDDPEDFDLSQVVKIGCLSELANDISLDIKEATCLSSGYDTESEPSLEYTITGKKLTPNFQCLNPMRRKGSNTRGFDITTVENVFTDGKVVLGDYATAECGFVMAQEVGGDLFAKTSLPTKSVDPEHFSVIGNTLYFNELNEGKSILVSYPREVEITEYVGDFDNINEVRCRISYPMTLTNGKTTRFVINRALITSYPQGLSTDEAELSVSFQAQKDSEGFYWRENEIAD